MNAAALRVCLGARRLGRLHHYAPGRGSANMEGQVQGSQSECCYFSANDDGESSWLRAS